MKILFIKTSSLGDIIHVFPALQFLRKKFNDAQIDWIVESPFADLVQSHPDVNQVFLTSTKVWRKGKNLKKFFTFREELRRTKYDVVFDLQGNIKSGIFLSCVRAAKKVGFGWKTLPEWPNGFFTNIKINPPPNKNIREDYLYLLQNYFGDFSSFKPEGVHLKLNENEKAQIEKVLAKVPAKKKILVAPGAAWKNKQLSIRSLYNFLNQTKNNFFLFSWGNEKERDISSQLHEKFKENSLLLERYSIPALQNLMSHVDLVVAMDSLPLHLCGTTETPSFSFFGPTNPLKYLPLGDRHQYIKGTCPYGVSFDKRCSKLRSCSTGSCIKEISISSLCRSLETKK